MKICSINMNYKMKMSLVNEYYSFYVTAVCFILLLHCNSSQHWPPVDSGS